MKPQIEINKDQLGNSRLLTWLAYFSIIISTILLSSNPVKAQYIPFTKITDDHFPQFNPVIDGNYIVYQDTRGGGLSDIYLYNRITKTEIALTSDPAVESIDPDISWNRVVWADNRDGNWEIYIYNVTTPEVDPQPLFVWEGDQIEPAIHGDVMVFSDKKPSPSSYNIYLFEFNTGVLTRLTDDTDGDQRNPDVFGNYAVWQDQRSGDWDIYMYQIDTQQETQVTDDPAYQSNPAIYGNRVVWQDYRNGNWDIYLHHITFGLGNAFYNFDFPVYSQSIGNLNAFDQIHPAIYGDYVVWEDYRNGNWDLYLYTFINDIVGWPSLILNEDFDQKNASIFEEFVVFQDERDNDGGIDIWQWEMPPGVDLAILIEDVPDPVITGGDLSYYVYIKNTGRQDADDVVVTCTLPDGVDRRYVTNSSGLGASILGNVVTCELGTMAPNDRDTLHIAVTPLDEAILSFSASVVTSDVDVNPDNNSQTISTEVIWALSDVIDIGMNPSLFMRGNASHVVYTDKSEGDYLKYATNKTGVWSRSILLEDHDNPIFDPHVAVDQHDTAHIVYYICKNWTTYEIYYIKETQSGWSTPLKLAESQNQFVGISIGCSPEGIVYVSYLKTMFFGNINLHYFNGTWNGPVIIETTAPAYNDLAMSVDKDGYLHFAYYELPWGPNYVTNAPDSVWKTSEPIHSGWKGGQCESLRLSIATDNDNRPHICYGGSYEDDYQENYMYAVKSSGTWSNDFVYDHLYSSFSSISTDNSNEPHICFTDHDNNGELIYASSTGGSWRFETLAHSAPEICSIKTDDEGYVHIAFVGYSSSYENSVVKYLTNRPEPPKPKISVSPDLIDFVIRAVGDTTETKKVIIENKGDAILHISNISLAWNDSIHFTITNNTCSSLNPSDTCSVDIVFNPKSFGDKKALLWIESNDPANPTEAVLLEGKGLAPMVWDYGSLSFGNVLVGDSATSVYTIKNKGNTNLLIQLIAIEENDTSDFYFTGLPDTPFDIAENDSIEFTIVFKPGSEGDKTSKLKIFTNDLDLTRIITGTGTMPSFSIEGTIVTPDGDLVSEGTIFVYTFENGESPAKLIWKPLEGATVYSFISVPQNTVTLWFKPDTSQYPGYLSTYLGNKALFTEADIFILEKDTAGLEITLIQAPPPPNGNSEISGTFVEEDGSKSTTSLSYGEYNGKGTPVSETSVYLIDQSGNIFDFDLTKSTGEFKFENIPIGHYKFIADYIEFSMDDTNDSLIISQENQKYNITAIAENKIITIEIENVTGISSLVENSILYVYPNPATDHIILQFNSNIHADEYIFKINSMAGKVMRNEVIHLHDGSQELNIRIDDLPSGIYLISLSGSNYIYKARFIKLK